MTLEDGTFASAQDAQVDGREGLNYLWTPELVREALAPARLTRDCRRSKIRTMLAPLVHPRRVRLDARRFAFRAFAGQRHKVIEFPGMYHELEKEPEVRNRVVSETIAWFRSHS